MTCLLLVAAATPQSGCASRRVRPVAPSAAASTYYPLAVGHTWTFQTLPAAPDGAPLVVRLERQTPDGFLESNLGSRLVARADGVFDGQRFLIQRPLEVGHAWLAVPSPSTVERYRIVARGVPVSVPAGTFSDCLQVEASQPIRARDGRSGRLVGVWSYARGVGPVHFRQWVELEGMRPQDSIEFRLRAYHLAGEGASPLADAAEDTPAARPAAASGMRVHP